MTAFPEFIEMFAQHFYNLVGQLGRKWVEERCDEMLVQRALATVTHQSTCAIYPTSASWVPDIV